MSVQNNFHRLWTLLQITDYQPKFHFYTFFLVAAPGIPPVTCLPFLSSAPLWDSSQGPIGFLWGGIFALRAHCALLLDYFPPEEPPSKPLGNALRFR